MKTNIFVRIIATVSAVATMALCGLAHAEGPTETTTGEVLTNFHSTARLPGSACRVMSAWMAGSLGVAMDGAIYNKNSATAPIWVECPVPVSGNGLPTILESEFYYIDDSENAITCSIIARELFTHQSNIMTVTTNENDNFYRAASLANLETYPQGSVTLRCKLPGKDVDGGYSYLVGYDVSDEKWSDKNHQIYPASNCRNTGVSMAIQYWNDGSIANGLSYGDSNATVDCPLTTLVFGIGSQVTREHMGVIEYVDHSTNPVACALRSDDGAGMASYEINFASSGIDENRTRIFMFDESSNFEFKHFKCQIPPKDQEGNESYIVSYRSYQK